MKGGRQRIDYGASHFLSASIFVLAGDYMHGLAKLLDKPMAEAITEIESNPAGIYGMLLRLRMESDSVKGFNTGRKSHKLIA